MAPVDRFNKYLRSWGYCSPHLKNIHYILDIFKNKFKGDIIKKNEYRNHLMIITNNCNQYIEDYLPINRTELEERKKAEKDKEKKERTIIGYNGVDITIEDTTKLEINFDDSDKSRKYKAVFEEYNLLNDTYYNTIFKISAGSYKTFYVRIEKNDNEFDIINIETGIRLNDKSFKYESFSSGSSGTEVGTIYTLAFTSIAIINNNVKAEQYNKDHYQPGGGILSKNKGKKGVYKSTKQKISVIIDKKSCDRTVYKNAKGISYIRCNNEYKLLKKYKLVKK